MKDRIRKDRNGKRGPEMAPLSRRSFLKNAGVALTLAALDALPAGAGVGRDSDRDPAAKKPVRRRALLIGVSQYVHNGPDGKPMTMYGNLNAAADVAAIKALLIERFGFKESDIVTLTTPKQTTKQAIHDAFQALIAGTNGPEDIIYFHYSGHGDTLADDRTAALIPADYRAGAKEKDPNVITENEFGKWLGDLKDKNSGGVFLSFDCCHSGHITSQTRGPKVVYRTRNKEAYPDPLPVPPGDGAANNKPDAGGDKRFAGERGFFALTACRYNELAAELTEKKMGRLSYALTAALADEKVQTYADLYEKVTGAMASEGSVQQTPQMDGDRTTTLFGTEIVVPAPYIRFEVRGDRPFLKAGQLHNMSFGSRFALYPAGTKNFADAAPLTENAKIIAVDLLESELSLPDMKPDDKRLIGARAVEREHIYDFPALRVELTKEAQEHEAGAALTVMLETLVKQKVIETKADAKLPFAYQIVRVRDAPGATAADTFALIRLNDPTPLFLGENRWKNNCVPDSVGAQNIALVLERGIKQQYKATQIRALGNTGRGDSGIQVSVRLVPCEVTHQDASDPRKVSFKSLLTPEKTRGANNGVWRSDEKDPLKSDYFVIQVKNLGPQDAYVYALDVDPAGRVQCLWPPDSRKGVNLIPKGTADWVFLGLTPTTPRTFHIEKPYGQEVIKVVATFPDAELGLIVDDAATAETRGISRGASTPLGRLLNNGASGTRAGGEVIPDSWDAATATLTVIPVK